MGVCTDTYVFFFRSRDCILSPTWFPLINSPRAPSQEGRRLCPGASGALLAWAGTVGRRPAKPGAPRPGSELSLGRSRSAIGTCPQGWRCLCPPSSVGAVSPSSAAARRASVCPLEEHFEEHSHSCPFPLIPPWSPLSGKNSALCGMALLSRVTLNPRKTS